MFANRLREMVEQLSFQYDASASISAGVGEYSAKEDEKSFFQRVDRALYHAKAQGRNTYRFYRPKAPTPLASCAARP